jgi:hypothetical protein
VNAYEVCQYKKKATVTAVTSQYRVLCIYRENKERKNRTLRWIMWFQKTGVYYKDREVICVWEIEYRYSDIVEFEMEII